MWQSLYKIVGKVAFLKTVYLAIYIGSVVLALGLVAIMNSSWSWVMPNLAPGIHCDNTLQDRHLNCVSASAVYRISLCLLVFSTVMLVILQGCSSRVGLILN